MHADRSASTRLFVTLPMANEPRADFGSVIELAQAAERAGVDGIIVTDHVVMGPDTDAYSWGPFPYPPEEPWLEPLTVLTAIAASTSTLTLATGILIAPLRPAALLAKTVATIDQLAPGRLELGVGTGWQRIEFDAQGLDFDARGALLDHTIATCQTLWRESPAPVTNSLGTFPQVWCSPQPVSSPLLSFSGTLSARNLRRIVEMGDGWIPIMKAEPDQIAEGVDSLRTAFAEAGRDASRLRVRAPVPGRAPDGTGLGLEAAIEATGAYVEAGVNDVSVPLGRFIGDAEPDDWFAHLMHEWSTR